MIRLSPMPGFNPRSREGATQKRPKIIQAAQSFNPRSREGATISIRRLFRLSRVSIHAPVRERRHDVPDVSVLCTVSIHAPVRERLHELMEQTKNDSFNPRSREGATMLARLQAVIDQVSIHAPVRERPANKIVVCRMVLFQSTLP